jgi:Na+/proline symporter
VNPSFYGLHCLEVNTLYNIGEMTTTDWILLTGFFAAIIVLTFIAALRARSPEEYFTGGRRSRFFTTLLFAFGSGTSSDSPSSVMAGTWRNGLAGLWWQFLWLPITPFYWVLAPLLRRLRVVTTADFFAMRFGPSTAALYSVYGIVIAIVLMAGVLFSSARLLGTVTDPYFTDVAERLDLHLPMVDVDVMFEPPSNERPPLITWKLVKRDELIAIGLAAVLIVSSGVGGLRAAILIDTIHGVLSVLLSMVLLPMIFHRIGGFGQLHKADSLKSAMFDFVASSDAAQHGGNEQFTPFYLFTLSLAALTGIVVQPHIMSITGSSRSEMGARIGFTFGNLLKRGMAVIWTLTALAAIAWYLGPNSPLRNETHPGDTALLQQLTTAAHAETIDLPAEEIEAAQQLSLEFSEELFGRMARDILGNVAPGVLGLVAVLVLSAAVSHCGTQLISATGLFAEYLCRQQLQPNRPYGHYVWIARAVAPVVVAIALLLQTTFADITDVLRLVIKTPAIVGISMWMGFFWTRWNTVSVWSTTLVASFVAMICGYWPEEIYRTIPLFKDLMFYETTDGLVMLDAWKIVCILSSGLCAGVVATLLTDHEPDDLLEYFYSVIRTPVAPNEVLTTQRFVPADEDGLEHVWALYGFQIPKPTGRGIAGFVVAWVVVIAMVYLTKWISLIV